MSEGELEEAELTGWGKWVVLGFVFLAIGFMLGVASQSFDDERTPDEVVDYFEESLRQMTKVRPNFINGWTTIDELTFRYFGYGYLSRSILKGELNRVCGGQWKVDIPEPDLNNTFNKFCSEVCFNKSQPRKRDTRDDIKGFGKMVGEMKFI